MSDINGAIGKVVERSLRNAAPAPDDYMAAGLLHCGKCHGRKQAVVELFGEKLVVGCMCPCQSAEYERQETEDKRRQRFHTVMQKLDWCDIGTKGRAEFCHPRVLQYLREWDRMLVSGTGLMLWGGVGTGKSTSAAWLVHELRRRFVPAIMTNFAQFGDVRTELPSFNGVDLLVLDDLGAERQSPFMLERVFEIVDGRGRCKKPTVFTTNLHIDDMKKAEEPQYRRLYSRVLERAVPVLFTGADHREARAAETIRAANRILGGDVG